MLVSVARSMGCCAVACACYCTVTLPTLSGVLGPLSYIPDWFRKWIDLLTYPYCKGANTHDVATGPHAIQMDIGAHFAAWTVGASLSYIAS